MKLKIKDDIDLKELEKYGFTEAETMGDLYWEKRYEKGFYKEYINIWKNDRVIQVSATRLLTTLYNLIEDGLVEKVEEEK